MIPKVFVPANQATNATNCYCNYFGGKTLHYNSIPRQEDEEDLIHCYRITLGSSDLLITDDDMLMNTCLQLNLHNSTDIRAARDFAKTNGCNVLRDVGEDPLRPGVLVATVTDPFKFVWQLSNSAGGLGPYEDGFLCFRCVRIVVIGGGNAEMFDIPGTPTVIPEDISRHEFFKRFWKGCREDVVVVVGYELSKEIVSYLRDNIGFRGMIVGLVSGSVDIDQEEQMMLMCQYGCDTSLGIPLTQRAIRNLVIAYLEKEEEEKAKAAAGSSTRKVESTERTNAKRLLSELRTEKEEALKRKIDEEKKEEALEKKVTKTEQEQEAEAPKEKNEKKKEEEEDKEKVEEEALRQQRKKRRTKKQRQQRRKISVGPFFRPPFLFAVRGGRL
ncbi:uncharacterized protein LOC109949356 [Prunus persica]|nr:uncharacterized protein LOC109949356 [Prunus persica]